MKRLSINRVVILVESPFTARDYDRYGIELLLKDFQVEVWDFSPFLRKSLYKLHVRNEEKEFSETEEFHSRGAALSRIDKLTQDFAVISVINFNPSSLEIYRTLSARNIFLGLLSTNGIPPRFPKDNLQKNIINKLKQSVTPQRVINALFRRIPIKYLGLRPANFVIAGGSKSLENASNKYSHLISSSTKIVWTHTMDYDIYLKSHHKPPSKDDNIAVFLDQYIPFHPDLRLKGETFDFDPDPYYQALSNFFSLVEKEFGLRVVIAAHPRSDYDNLPDYFGGREVVSGKTSHLIERSKLVLLHFSTAINFAIFYKKPILFLSTENAEGTFLRDYIWSMASLLQKQPISIDGQKSDDLRQKMVVDPKIYENYREMFIKRNGTPEKQIWEIAADFLLLQ